MSVLYYIYNKNDRHLKIRLKTVTKIVNQWVFYKDFVMDLSYRTVISSNKDKNKSADKRASFDRYKLIITLASNIKKRKKKVILVLKEGT